MNPSTEDPTLAPEVPAQPETPQNEVIDKAEMHDDQDTEDAKPQSPGGSGPWPPLYKKDGKTPTDLGDPSSWED